MAAALGGHEAVVKLLLGHRADVRAVAEKGATALMVAKSHEAVARLLREHGAPPPQRARWVPIFEFVVMALIFRYFMRAVGIHVFMAFVFVALPTKRGQQAFAFLFQAACENICEIFRH